MDLELIKRTAVAASYQGAEALRSRFGRLSSIKKKNPNDLVTEADTAAEACILETIRALFPDHAIMAEESGLSSGDKDHLWIVDPLDGTTNFAHRVDLYAVSIAYALRGEVTVGVVLNPAGGELFSAVAGGGATLNGAPINVSPVDSLSDSLLVTGFPYNIRDCLEPVMQRFSRCLGAAQGTRRLGSAALDLCYVACGRFEGFWEEYLKPWDTAAGMLVAREAGAAVTDFANRPYTLNSSELLATNGRIHREMLSLLNIA